MCVAVCCSELQRGAMCCSMLPLQRAAVCCSMLFRENLSLRCKGHVALGSDVCVAVCPRCCSMLQHALSRRSITHTKVHHSCGKNVSRGRYSQNLSCDSIESMDLHMSDEVMDLHISDEVMDFHMSDEVMDLDRSNYQVN